MGRNLGKLSLPIGIAGPSPQAVMPTYGMGALEMLRVEADMTCIAESGVHPAIAGAAVPAEIPHTTCSVWPGSQQSGGDLATYVSPRAGHIELIN